jgi:hypothetical protein
MVLPALRPHLLPPSDAESRRTHSSGLRFENAAVNALDRTIRTKSADDDLRPRQVTVVPSEIAELTDPGRNSR